MTSTLVEPQELRGMVSKTPRYAVRIWFQEQGTTVYDELGPYTYPAAQACCESMAGGIVRGERWVHVDRALIVPWVSEQL
jgi:hypothetical protein